MKKWFDEEYEFTVEVTGFLRGDHTERYCRNGEEIGDTYTCTYGCPVTLDFEDRHYERKRADLNFRLDKVYDKIEELEEQLLAVRAKKLR